MQRMRMMTFGRQSPRGLLLPLLCLLVTCSAPIQGWLMPDGFHTVGIGIMNPPSAYLLVGETLVMNCTLDRNKEEASQYTAHQLFFEPSAIIKSNRDWAAAGLQTVLNNDTLQLTVPDVTRDDSGPVNCKLHLEGQDPRFVVGGMVTVTAFKWLDSYILGNMNPPDAYPLVGETLVMNCTLDRNKVASQYTAHQLLFQPGTDIKSRSTRDWAAAGLQTVLNNDTLQLTVPDVTRDDSGHVYCKLQPEGQDPRHVVGGTVTVTAPPELGNMTCISHNHQDLNCSFCPDVYTPDDYTIYDIKFFVTNGEYPKTCDEQDNPTCTCYVKRHFLPGLIHLFRVTVSNTARDISITREYDAIRTVATVKTDPVVDLETSSVGSRVVEGHFEQPSLTAHLVLEYTLSITTDNPALPNHTEILGANNSFRVEGLHPYTRYRVSVISRVVQSPYFSDPAHIDIDTAVDAPAFGPPVPIGAMRKGVPCREENCHEFHLYWGMLEELSHNGPLDGYNASLLNSAGQVIEERDVGTASVYTAMMSDRQAYTVCVSAYNTLDGTKLYSPPSCIERQPVSRMLANAEVWAERLDDVIIMNIDAPADTNITVFACEPIDNSLTDCRDPIVSETIAGSVKQYNTSHRENFMYSVSASKDGAFSGMTDDWICFSVYHKRAGEVESFSIQATEQRSLIATWDRRLCTVPNREGRVLYYELYWQCETGEEGNVTVAEDRSEYKISGLQSFSSCTVSIQAVARGGEGRRSVKQARTQLESAPGSPPQNVRISNVTAESFLVSYNPSPQPNGRITKYRITIKTGGTVVMKPESALLHHEVRGLEGYRNYSVEVVAVNNAGSSLPSQVVNEQTLIGVPSTISKSDITATNSPSDTSVVTVTWKAPARPNGPIDHYIVRLLDSKGKEQKECVSGDVLTYDVTHPCEGEEVRVNVTVRAVNINEQGVKMEGQESPQPEETTACATPFPVTLVAVLVSISVVVAICVLVIFLRKAVKKTKEGILVLVPTDQSDTKGNQHEAYVQDSGYSVPGTGTKGKGGPLLRETSESGRSGSLSTSPSLTSSEGYIPPAQTTAIILRIV